MTLQGGRLRGQVRYRFKAEPVFVCHFANCQRQSGAAFSVNVGVREDALDLTGTLKTFVDHGESGREVLRRFCPNFGSPVITDAEAIPGIHLVKAGTLDDPTSLEPGRQIFCASKHPWMPVLNGITLSNSRGNVNGTEQFDNELYVRDLDCSVHRSGARWAIGDWSHCHFHPC